MHGKATKRGREKGEKEAGAITNEEGDKNERGKKWP